MTGMDFYSFLIINYYQKDSSFFVSVTKKYIRLKGNNFTQDTTTTTTTTTIIINNNIDPFINLDVISPTYSLSNFMMLLFGRAYEDLKGTRVVQETYDALALGKCN